MKVLHVYRTYFPDPPGGLQEAIRQICISTQPYGVENTVFTLSPNPAPKSLDRPEAKVVRCRSWIAPASCDLGGLDAVQTFRALAQQADVIHYLFPWPYADVLRLLAPKKPSVLTYVSDIVRQRWMGAAYGPLMWHTLRRMDAIVCNAPRYAAGSAVLTHPELQPLVRHIPLGIDESAYATPADTAVLDRLGLQASEPFVLFIGVLRYYKGLHVLLDACANVKGRVVIAGTGPEEQALKDQVARLGLNNVLLAGRVTEGEKIALLQACRGLVLPSHLRSEAYGMVLVEASIMSRPMVTCEIGTGTSFVNSDGETGWVVPPKSPTALAVALNRLLTDAELAQRYGRAARQRYEALFSGDALGRAYARLFEGVLNP
jgi:rhamnosyl/mannosyltransferase